jgi:hypothetical protein
LAKLTVASTPGNLFRFFSIRIAHAAQVMPSIGKSICLGVAVFISFFPQASRNRDAAMMDNNIYHMATGL